MGKGQRHIPACRPDEPPPSRCCSEQCLGLHGIGRLYQYAAPDVLRNNMPLLICLFPTVIVSFAIGSLLLLAILIKYIHSRAVLMSWNVRYGQNSTQTTNPYSGNGSMPSGPRPTIPRRNIYDSWLAVRFTVAFVALGYVSNPILLFIASILSQVNTLSLTFTDSSN